VVGLAPMQHLIFSGMGDVTGPEMKAFLQQECAKLGVLFVGYHHTSFAHSERDIKTTLDVYENTFSRLAAALREGNLKSKLVAKPFLHTGVRKD
jgi:hypothetical protein